MKACHCLGPFDWCLLFFRNSHTESQFTCEVLHKAARSIQRSCGRSVLLELYSVRKVGNFRQAYITFKRFSRSTEPGTMLRSYQSYHWFKRKYNGVTRAELTYENILAFSAFNQIWSFYHNVNILWDRLYHANDFWDSLPTLYIVKEMELSRKTPDSWCKVIFWGDDVVEFAVVDLKLPAPSPCW